MGDLPPQLDTNQAEKPDYKKYEDCCSDEQELDQLEGVPDSFQNSPFKFNDYRRSISGGGFSKDYTKFRQPAVKSATTPLPIENSHLVLTC